MLDRINNTNSEQITQSQNIDKIAGYGATNPIDNDKNYFIDQSEISSLAFEKYQKEEDIRSFSEIFMGISEKEANDLVISKALDGQISINDNNILAELLDNTDFINDVIE